MCQRDSDRVHSASVAVTLYTVPVWQWTAPLPSRNVTVTVYTVAVWQRGCVHRDSATASVYTVTVLQSKCDFDCVQTQSVTESVYTVIA